MVRENFNASEGLALRNRGHLHGLTRFERRKRMGHDQGRENVEMLKCGWCGFYAFVIVKVVGTGVVCGL